MSQTLIFVLSISLLVSLVNASPQNHPRWETCRIEYNQVKDCLRSWMSKLSEGIALLREDRLGEFVAVDGSIDQVAGSCNKVLQRYEGCCAGQDCSLMEDKKEAIKTRVRDLGEELKEEKSRAALRARMNPRQ